MQTFLPYASFEQSAKCLDKKRLGNQRVEAQQILNVLNRSDHLKRTKSGKIAWQNHPAVLMWAGYETALKHYFNAILLEWIARGYKNNYEPYDDLSQDFEMPWWIGNEQFHSSHRQTLLSKDQEHYSQFGWKEEPKYEYWWPSKNIQTKIEF